MSKINDINKKTSLGKISIKKDGNITEKGIYRNGKLDGIFLKWTTPHNQKRPLLISSEHYKDGKLHGPRYFLIFTIALKMDYFIMRIF